MYNLKKYLIRNSVVCLFLFFISNGSYSALVPDYYSEPGIDPNRAYVEQSFSESIDPFTGKLQLHYVDLHIPGNNGMDVMVQRSYTSLDDELTDQDPQSIIGFGWTLHYGRIKRSKTTTCSGNQLNTSNDNPVLQLPDGKEEVFFYRANTSISGGYEYISKNNWVAECTGGSNDPADSWTVKSPDGRVYVMSKKIQPDGDLAYWYTKTITDSANNVITVNYKGDSYDSFHGYNQKPFISSVTGQDITVAFSYLNDNPSNYQHMRLRRVSANSRVVTYGYDRVGTTEHYRLDSVDLPGASNVTGSWNYKYHINESNLSENNRGRFSISEVEYPKGGRINYTYEHNYFISGSNIRTTSISTKNISGPSVTGGRWTYSYQKSSSSNELDTTTIQAPDGTYTYKHYGADGAVTGEVWRVGLLREKQVTGGGTTQREIYDWVGRRISNETYNGPRRQLQDNAINAPLLERKVITRDGNNYTTDYRNFDSYGNPRTIVETGSPSSASKTTDYTYFNNTSVWIIGRLKNETVNDAATVNGTTIDAYTNRTFYTSGRKTGKLNTLNENGVTTSYDYHNTGNLYMETDARQNTTYHRDYYRGIARDVDYPDSTGIQRRVNSTGTIEWERNARGITTSYTYDGLNRLSSIAFPSPKRDVSIDWPSIRNRVVSRGAYRESAVYDGFGNVISITKQDADLNISIVTNARYDPMGRLTYESYAGDTVGTRYTYDVLGRLRNIYHQANTSNNGVASRSYDYLTGNRMRITDERNNITYHTYRAYGDPDQQTLIRIAAPENIAIDITRNKLGLIDSISMGGKYRRYYYDSHLFLNSIRNPETGRTVYTRDAVGNMKTRRVGNSGNTCFEYDSRNRLKEIYFQPANCDSLPAMPDIEYVYDQNGNKERVINHADGVTRDYDYDLTDNLDMATLSIGQQRLSVDYVINDLDQTQAIIYPKGRTVEYNPDALGRPTTASPYVINVEHHPNGLVGKVEYENGVVTTSTLTRRKWVDVLQITDNHSNLLFGWDYNYDHLGNVEMINDIKDSANNIDPTYDAANRLASIVGPWGGTHATNRITYDTRGNIESKRMGSVGLNYAYNDNSDRLMSISGSLSRSYGYDDYGNITGDGRLTFDYNHNSVLTHVTGSGLSVDYVYDGDKRLVKTTKEGSTTLFFYDTADKLLGEYDTSLNLQKEYVYLGNQLIATIANAPEIPSSIGVSTPDSSGSHSVSWSRVTENVTHYEVVQSLDPFAPEAGSIVYTGTALRHSLTEASGTYYYFVRACNGNECSDYRSNSSDCAVIGASSAPCMPSSVSVPSNSGSGSYNVSWTASEGSITNYHIQESLDDNFSTINNSYNFTTSPLRVSGKGDGTYYYRVRACNGSHCSPYVATNGGVSVLILPDAPADLVVPSQVSGSSYTVSWSSVTGGITAYKLYEATNSEFNGEALVYQGTARSYGITGKSADGIYYYRVVACKQDTCSNSTVATKPAIVRHAPTIPQSMSVPESNTSGNYTITWASSSGRVTRYELEESTANDFAYSDTVYLGQALSGDMTGKLDGVYYYRLRACNDFACSGYRVALNPVQVTGSPYTAALIAILSGILLF
jgi:hypothetical protein